MGHGRSTRWRSRVPVFVAQAAVVAVAAALVAGAVAGVLSLVVAGWAVVAFAVVMLAVSPVLLPRPAPFLASGHTVVASSGQFGVLLLLVAAGLLMATAGADPDSAAMRAGRGAGLVVAAVVLGVLGLALFLLPQRVTLSRDGMTRRLAGVSRSVRWDEVDVARLHPDGMNVRVLAEDGRAVNVAVGLLPLSAETLVRAVTYYAEDADHRREIGTAESLRRVVDPARVPGGARRGSGGRRSRRDPGS